MLKIELGPKPVLKIFDGEKVYVPIHELTTRIFNHIEPKDMHDFEGIGFAVPEDVYNRAILKTEKGQAGMVLDFTKVDSLKVKLKEVQDIRPLKFLFLSGMKKDQKAIEKEIQRSEEEFARQTMTQLKDTSLRLSSSYRDTVAFLQEQKEVLKEALKRCGLELQFVTQINTKRCAGLSVYLAGKDVFYEVFMNEWTPDCLEALRRTEDGRICIPEPEEEEDAFLIPKNIGRDFRQFPAIENLAWCLQNLPVRNDSTDELNYRQDGIAFCVSTKFLVKLFNQKAFPEEYFFEGICEVQEKVRNTEN